MGHSAETEPVLRHATIESNPFSWLSPREIELLQHTANGLTNDEIGIQLEGTSTKAVEYRKQKMLKKYGANTYLIMILLIRFGINQDYLDHQLPEDYSPTALTPRENEVLQGILEGERQKQISDRLLITTKSVETYIGHIHAKLGTQNAYHLAARTTYLKKNDMWPI